MRVANLETIRAKHAWELILWIDESVKNKKKRESARTLLRKLPDMILVNGFGQAIAFLLAKAKSEAEDTQGQEEQNKKNAMDNGSKNTESRGKNDKAEEKTEHVENQTNGSDKSNVYRMIADNIATHLRTVLKFESLNSGMRIVELIVKLATEEPGRANSTYVLMSKEALRYAIWLKRLAEATLGD